MSKNKLTRVEKMFQDKLHDESILNQDWNMPSDELFLAAMDKIDEDKEKEKAFAYWYVIGMVVFVLILVSIFRQYYTYQRTNTTASNSTIISQSNNQRLQNEIIQQVKPSISNAIESKQSITTDTPAKNEEIVNTNNLNVNNSEEGVQLTKVNRTALLIKTTGNHVAKSTNTRTITVESFNKPTTNNPINTNSHEIYQASTIIIDANEEKIKVATISSVLSESFIDNLLVGNTFKKNTLEEQKEVLNEEWINGLTLNELTVPKWSNAIPEINAVTKVINKRTEVYGIAGSNFAALHMRPIPANGFTLTEYDSRSVGYFGGVGLRQQLSKKWSLAVDLRYSRMYNSSVFEEDHQYNLANEIVDVQGNKVYNTNIVVVSPTTQFDFDMKLNVEGSISDNEMLHHTTSINQTYEIIGLNIQPVYNLINKGRFAFEILGGIEGDYILSFYQDMNLKMEYGDKIMIRESMKLDDANELNRLFLGASAGANIQYRWTERLSSGLTLSGMSGLTSIKNTSDGVYTYISDIRVGFKTSYSF